MADRLLYHPQPPHTIPSAITSLEDPPTALSLASAPFNSPDADLILRSSDLVTFRVFKRILSEASAVFADMLAVGDHKHVNTQGTAQTDLPSVDLAEDSGVLNDLLQFIYPVPNPAIQTLDYCTMLLSAADKYALEAATHALKQCLISPPFLEKSPIRVYAIACSHGFMSEATIASRYTLSFEVLKTDIYEEFARVTARDFLKLIQLHQVRSETALAIVESAGPVPCGGCGLLNLPAWFVEWKRRAREELLVRPTTNIIFKPEFLASCVSAVRHCSQCAVSYTSPGTQVRLQAFQQKIDNLPNEIQ